MKILRILSVMLLLNLVVFLPDLLKSSVIGRSFAYSPSGVPKEVYAGEGVRVLRSNNFDIYIFDAKKHRFGVSTSRSRGKRFYMNANFFTEPPHVKPMGLVVEDGRRRSPALTRGGSFYVVGGLADVRRGPCPSGVRHAAQSILWGIDDGKVNRGLLSSARSRFLTYRNLVGRNGRGDIVFIVSHFGGVVRMMDVVDEGIRQGLVEALPFDAGTSVEYAFRDGGHSRSFTAVSDLSKAIVGIDRPVSYMYVE
jgi:hypothetical protein